MIAKFGKEFFNEITFSASNNMIGEYVTLHSALSISDINDYSVFYINIIDKSVIRLPAFIFDTAYWIKYTDDKLFLYVPNISKNVILYKKVHYDYYIVSNTHLIESYINGYSNKVIISKTKMYIYVTRHNVLYRISTKNLVNTKKDDIIRYVRTYLNSSLSEIISWHNVIIDKEKLKRNIPVKNYYSYELTSKYPDSSMIVLPRYRKEFMIKKLFNIWGNNNNSGDMKRADLTLSYNSMSFLTNITLQDILYSHSELDRVRFNKIPSFKAKLNLYSIFNTEKDGE